MLQSESLFPRLIELLRSKRDHESINDFRRMLLELLFEMSRVQKLNRNDLSELNRMMMRTLPNVLAAAVDDDFVLYLLQLIEDLSNDVDDPYHYPIIRVLVRSTYRSLTQTTSLIGRSLF